jgi:hypothetical protein
LNNFIYFPIVDNCNTAYTPCDSTHYLTYNDAELGMKGIYGTSGNCNSVKLSYGQACPSHASCNDNMALACTDNGCDCEPNDLHWNSVSGSCVTADLLCSDANSHLVCGSCIKLFTGNSNFNDAQAQCVASSEFQNLLMFRNMAQWYYATNLTAASGSNWVYILLINNYKEVSI